MNSWIAVLVTISFIIFVHELGHFLMARFIGVRVERFSLGFGPRLLKVKRGETEYAFSLFPVGGYVKMAGESEGEGSQQPWEYRSRSILERMWIVLAGPLVNYLVGFLLFVLIFWTGAPVISTRIGEVLEGYPAAQAGLQVADKILAINGLTVEDWEEVTRTIHAQTGAIELTVDRGGQIHRITVLPRVRQMKNILGTPIRVAMVGITPGQDLEIRRYALPQSLVKAGERVWMLTHLTLQALWQIATGGLPLRESMTGPVGIFYLTSSVAKQGFVHLVQLVAILSTSLGLFNLLPLPVLDGGHCLFLLIERIKGTPVSVRVQERLTQVGFALLLLLLVVVTYNDLVKFRVFGEFLP